MIDQFFWGRLVEDVGLSGVVEPSMREATADSYLWALKIALQADVMKKAAAFGDNIRPRGSGAKIAADFLGSQVS